MHPDTPRKGDMLTSFVESLNNEKDGYSLTKELRLVRTSKRVWLTFACMVLIFILGACVPASKTGRKSLFQVIPSTAGGEDIHIPNPMYNEALISQTVPTWVMVILASLIPLIVVIITNAVYRVPKDFEAFISGLIRSVCMEAVVVEALKTFCGYPRPNAIALCKYDAQLQKCTSFSDEYLRSFPSGHTGVAFASMLYLSLYLWGKLETRRGESMGTRQVSSGLLESQRNSAKGNGDIKWRKVRNFVKAGIVCLPVLLALFIGASRIHDRYHWPADVIMGSLIGSIAAITSYLSHFHVPWDPNRSHLPLIVSGLVAHQPLYSPENNVADFL